MTIVNFNADQATWIGNEQDGCYVQVGKDLNHKWYITVLMDSDACVAPIYTDEGPYSTQDNALKDGIQMAIDWCVDNHVQWKTTSKVVDIWDGDDVPW